MYNIFKIDNNKLTPMFNKSYEDYSLAIKDLKYWYETKRNDSSKQFLIIDKEGFSYLHSEESVNSYLYLFEKGKEII